MAAFTLETDKETDFLGTSRLNLKVDLAVWKDDFENDLAV